MLYNVNKQGCLRTYWAQRQEEEPLNRRGTKSKGHAYTRENLYCFKEEQEKNSKEVHLDFSFSIRQKLGKECKAIQNVKFLH